MIRPGSSARHHQSEGALGSHFASRPAVKQDSQHSLHLRPNEYEQCTGMPDLDDLITKRDYVGAITLLRFEKKANISREKQDRWLAYCYFHAGLFHKALRIIDRLLTLYPPEQQPNQSGNTESGYAKIGKQAQKGDSFGSSNLEKGANEVSSLHGSSAHSDTVDIQVEREKIERNFSFRRSIYVPKELQDSDLDSSDGEGTGRAKEAPAVPRKSQIQETAATNETEERGDENQSILHLCRALCLYALSAFREAQRAASRAPPSKTRQRLLLHVAHQLKEEQVAEQLLGELDRNDIVDQMSVASIEFLRGHPDVAYQIYRALLLRNPSYEALKVHAALCAFNSGQHKTAKSLLKEYRRPSLIVANLLACCVYEEGGGPSACLKVYHQLARDAGTEEDLFIQNHDLLRHNSCIFHRGENALTVFGPLAGVLPEARLNLTTVYLKYGNYSAAFGLMQDFEPSTVAEVMCKATVFLLFGQRRNSLSHLEDAAKMFYAVASTSGNSKMGLQSMFNYCFLMKDYRGALDYAERLASYHSDANFFWNKCVALTLTGDYAQAKEALMSINDTQCKDELLYFRWLCRLHIFTGDSSAAIDQCINQIRNPSPTLAASLTCSWDGYSLLKEVGDDCYAVGDFYTAMKAFSLLDKERCDPFLWPALRGAAAGFLHKVLTHNEDVSRVPEVLRLLRHSSATRVAQIVSCLKNVAKSYNVPLE